MKNSISTPNFTLSDINPTLVNVSALKRSKSYKLLYENWVEEFEYKDAINYVKTIYEETFISDTLRIKHLVLNEHENKLRADMSSVLNTQSGKYFIDFIKNKFIQSGLIEFKSTLITTRINEEYTLTIQKYILNTKSNFLNKIFFKDKRDSVVLELKSIENRVLFILKHYPHPQKERNHFNNFETILEFLVTD